jgi:ubiquinone/menaquinone biosynthesis C-methylase UbiE
MTRKPRARAASTDAMRRDWDARAKVDALFHVDASRPGSTVDEFYARGPALVAEIVDPVLEQLGVDPSGQRVLEVGCGMGRLFAGLADRFGDVLGIDISPEMVARGRAQCPVAATWLVGDGRSLPGVPDASVDHVLSFEVFQHIPDRAVIDSYVAETFRVLRPGGTFQLHLRRSSDSFRQAVVRALPRPARMTVAAALKAVGLLHAHGDVDTWLGCVVHPASALEIGEGVGFCDLRVLPDRLHATEMGYWLVGRKGDGGSRSERSDTATAITPRSAQA